MKTTIRRILATFLALVLAISMSTVAIAATPVASTDNPPTSSQEERVSNIKDEPVGEFDYTVLQSLPGYNYDKFAKCWSYYAAYDKSFSDADVVIAIKLFGEDGGNNLEEADLYAKVIDKNGNPLKTVSSMDYLVDDVLYSYNEMPGEDGTMAGSVFLYDTGYELVKAFADAKEVSVKLSFYDNTTMTLDLDMAQFSTTIQALCKNVVKYNIWDYYISNWFMGSIESMWNLTITE